MIDFFNKYNSLITAFIGFYIVLRCVYFFYRNWWVVKQRQKKMRHAHFTHFYGKDYKNNPEYKAFMDRGRNHG